ncbi:MAG: hypothetical protein CMO01_19930 [Thalassobius sp.]|nr:hypothetical protein [Thalassovita sp.]
MGRKTLAWVVLLFMQVTTSLAQQTDETLQLAIDVLIEKASESINQSPDSAFLYSKQALKLAKESGYDKGEVAVHLMLGEIFYHQGAYDQALSHHIQASEHFRNKKNQRKLAASYHRMGEIYYASKQSNSAFKHQQYALAIYSDIADTLGIAEVFGSIGHLFEKKQQYDSALYYQNESLKLYQQLQDSAGIAHIYENIGSVYEDQEKFGEAHNYFFQAYLLNKQMNNRYELLNNLNNLGDTFRKTGRYAEALEYTQQALDLATDLDEQNQISSAYRDLGKAYHEMGNDSQAYFYLNKGRELYEKIYTEEATQQIALLQTLFEIEKKNNEIELLERGKQLDNLIRLIIFVVGLLLLVLAISIISRQRLKIRNDKQLLDERDKSYQAEKNLMKVELDNKKLSEERLQDELKGKSKELTTHTLHIITKNQILEELKDDILAILNDESRGHRKELKKLVKKIDLNFQKDNDWDDFRQIFEKVHESFFDNLLNQFPDLTSKEKRLAALIKLNMNSQDIATIMAISSDSLRIARYRLRKKLQIPKEEKLEAFIQKF